jgi:DNA-binding transcriptional regulator LsrR (DeoR family)
MARFGSVEDLRLMSKIGKLYYEQGLTQDEIVNQMHLSRSKISRLLHQARDNGIIKITVIPPPGVYSDWEMQLEKRFRLKEVIIVEIDHPDSAEEVARGLGATAANYIKRILNDGDVIGISWGRTLSAMVSALLPHHCPNSQIIQMIGGLGWPESEIHTTELCRRMALLLNCSFILLPAPGIANNLQSKEVLLTDKYVQRALSLFSKIDAAFVGIGAPTQDSLVLSSGSIISQPELQELLSKGSVGDIAMRFFDCFGQSIHSSFNDRVIGIPLEQLSQVKRVVGVAGGPNKKAAILGALRGGLINVLITDHSTANHILMYA